MFDALDPTHGKKTVAVLREVNCVGVAADQAAKSFDERYQDNAVAFKSEFDLGQVEPGRAFCFDRGAEATPRFVFNLPTKIHWKAKTKIECLRQGIEDVVELCLRHHVDRLEVYEFDEIPDSLTTQQVKIEFLTSFARIPEIKLRFRQELDGEKTPKQVTVFTDGGAEPNPGVGGYGVLLQFGNVEKELSQGFQRTTNQRMELLAAVVALESLKESCIVRMYSDAKYIVDPVSTGALFRWRAKNWKNGKVGNIDLWTRFLNAYLEHEVEMFWVKGHSGIEGNERCDKLASDAIASQDLEIDQGYLDWVAANPPKAQTKKSKSGNPAKSPSQPQSNQKAKLGPKPTQVGDPCRQCQTALIRRETRKSNPKSNYYYPWYLYCNHCNRMYHVKAAKVYR